MAVNAPGGSSRAPGWPWTEVGQLVVEAESLLWSGDRTGALALLEYAVSLDAIPVERYTVGTALLRASNCVRGWDLYDLHPSRPVDRLPGVTRWRGEPCRLLVVVAEQGFGDAIQFLRFIPHVANRAESVVVAVHDELLDVVATSPLLRNLEVIPKSVAQKTAWPAHARWERVMSLPATIPNFRVDAADAYLRVTPQQNEPSLYPSPSGVATVGVAWRSTHRRGFPDRSIPARLMSRLTDSDRIRAVALHRNKDIRALPRGVETVRIKNLAETARAISQCDWVVTADTVTAHLAPALGIPTIVCLLHTPDWRWGAPSIPTRWYATAETIFQDESGDWGPVLTDAAHRVLGRSVAIAVRRRSPQRPDMTASDEPTPWAVAVRLTTASGVPTELLRNLHDLHGRQWQLEDATRNRRASSHSIAAAKAEIDTSNARRQQVIDAIDAAADVTPAEGATRYYSETVGELCDRLLILEHKLAALERPQARADAASAEPRSAAACRVRAVCAHLSVVVTRLIEDIAAEQAAVPPRAGVKVYNGSTGGGEASPGPEGDPSAVTKR